MLAGSGGERAAAADRPGKPAAPASRMAASSSWFVPVFLLGFVWVCLPVSALVSESRADFFDAHLHYRPAHAEVFPPERVAEKFLRHGVQAAVILSTDAELVARLAAQTDARLLPFLEVSHQVGNRLGWMREPDLAGRAVAMLQDPAPVPWVGLGELHIMAGDRFGSGFAQLLALAVETDLVLMIHGDPAVIDRAYELQPEVRILWAHAGSFAYPPLLADYLQRYPQMSMDLSMRNPRIAPDGHVDPDWFELFLDFPDRFMLGVDTFSLTRWGEFGAYYAEATSWLADLPDAVARAIAFENGLRFFGVAQWQADVHEDAGRPTPME